MKSKHVFILFFLIISQALFAQKDTIIGVLLDIDQKIIKKYPVALGRLSPVKVKTDKNGIFVFPDVNLLDTLFVGDKKGRNNIAIPVNGHRFITIQSLKGNFNTEYFSEPADQILRYMKQQESFRKKNSNMLNREDIVNSGCRDVTCVLRRFSGVTVSNNAIIIRGTSTLQGQATNSALIVIDGIPGGSINNVTIDDIEEISVLKDASMYGSRGANGAIVIRTRR